MHTNVCIQIYRIIAPLYVYAFVGISLFIHHSDWHQASHWINMPMLPINLFFSFWQLCPVSDRFKNMCDIFCQCICKASLAYLIISFSDPVCHQIFNWCIYMRGGLYVTTFFKNPWPSAINALFYGCACASELCKECDTKCSCSLLYNS